jgi:hypothetical protein
MIKTTLALMSVLCASLTMVSCENFPYKPQQFTAPIPPAPPNAFVSKDSLSAFVGTSNVKITYTKMIAGGTQLAYFVDFSDSLVTPKLLNRPSDKQDWTVWCPIISPDGALVAYFLVDPNNSKHAAAYCQKLDTSAIPNLIDDPGSDPHFYMDSQNHEYIIYADTTDIMHADYSTLTTKHTYKVQIDAATGQKTGTRTSIVPYPFYGGISPDGKYVCTGYANAYLYNSVSQKFFTVNPNVQTCNPSISPDTSHQGLLMFLNIGGPQSINNMGTLSAANLGEHKYVLTADTGNNLVNAFNVAQVLPDYASGEWQCPKWTNAPDFFCSLATKSLSGNTIVYDCFIVSISSGKALLLNVKPELLQFNGTSKPYVYIGAR